MKHDDMKEDKPLIKKIAKKAVKSHEKKLHGMKKGGVTGEAMRKVGRNMARANNQRGR